MLYFKSRGEKTPLRQSKSAGSSKVSADGIETEIHVDSTYNPSSHNAQSGKAVAQATQQSLEKLTSQLGSVLRYKGSKATYQELTQLTQKETGDVYDIISGEQAGANYVWTGQEWDKLSEDLTKLVKETEFNSLKSSIDSHIANSDTEAKHLDSTNYQKLQQVTVYSSESLDKLIDEVLKQYVDEGELVTEESLQEQLTQVETTIQTSVVESVKTQMSNSFLTAEELATYKSEIDTKKKKLIKCEQADTLDVYVEGDNRKAPLLANRKARTIYLIGEGAEFEDGSEPEEPTVDETQEMLLEIDTNGIVPEDGGDTYRIGLAPILCASNSSNVKTLARIEWGDSTASVTIDDTTASNTSILQHSYQLNGNYTLKITGNIKWSGLHEQFYEKQIAPAVLLDDYLSNVLHSITISNGKSSPIKEIGQWAFAGYNDLKTIPENLFDNCNPKSLRGTFYDSGLTSIPPNLFSKCTQLTDVSYCFCCCENDSIPAGLFANCPHLQTCDHCFCELDGSFHSTTHITEIPENLFDECNEITSFHDCFEGCSGITGPVPALWETYTDNQDGSGCFTGCENCQNWDSIPEAWGGDPDPEVDYQGYTPGTMVLTIKTTSPGQIVNLGYNLGRWESEEEASLKYPTTGYITWDDGEEKVAFYGDEGIEEQDNPLVHVYEEIGEHHITIEGVVKWNRIATTNSNGPNSIREVLKKIEISKGETSPIYFIDQYAFYYYTLLESIPGNLFDNCTEVTDFSYCFYNTKITAIPQDLFANCTQATNFYSCFSSTQITAIPEGLFDKCTQVTTFYFCFNNTKITAIPKGLFDHCPLVTNFSYCFYNTKITAIPENLFANNNAVTGFAYTFYDCTSVKGNLPALWNTHSTVQTYTRCFYKCTLATNYAAAQAAGWA